MKSERSQLSSMGTDEKNTLNYRVEVYAKQFFAAFFLLGIFNNNGFTMVQAGSHSLAKAFGQEDFMGVF